ncbi:hypothetical protein RJD28_08300 [Oscillospiraceae bacterium NTUH-002-81]|nr:hypothetical protein RJD28_08300 [Oscillospiraceae bacterium NTUH-002-81]
MAIKPILFNGEMVRAILDGRKICTRRLVKHNVDAVLNSPYHMEHPETEDVWLIKRLCRAPYDPGDILYVRETWDWDPDNEVAKTYYYKADGDLRPEGYKGMGWLPSIHMPKEAARIWLKVTDVRVERLQDITAEQILKEGIGLTQDMIESVKEMKEHCDIPFAATWNHTLKKSDLDRYGWAANPWVWVIEFERCEKPKEAE